MRNGNPKVSEDSVSPNMPAEGKPKLIEQMRRALRSRHYSQSTETLYCYWVRRYCHFHNLCHPREMGEAEVNAFLTNLAMRNKVSASTQNQALSGLLFLYRYALERPLGDLGQLIRARKPRRLPVVLTRQEVKALLAQLTDQKWLMGALMYGAGLRVIECLHLRVQDLDFGAGQILVRDGKGFKDRITMLPEAVCQPLRPHRSRCIQELLGHKDVATTMIYTHVLNRGGKGVRSPVDMP